MRIVTLAPGEAAPIDSDCISIDRIDGDMFTLTGSLLAGDESVSIVGVTHQTREAAESEGLAWAADNNVAVLYVATSG